MTKQQYEILLDEAEAWEDILDEYNLIEYANSRAEEE